MCEKTLDMNFAVIFTYSFDGDTAVYLFETEDDAKKFLKDSFYEEVRIDTEENQWDTSYSISDDGLYAEIINHFNDRDDRTFMLVGQIYR